MWAMDFSTLVLILAAGFELGAEGAFGISPFGWLLGSWKYVAYDVTGIAAFWQLSRQNFR